ncbi:acrylyl-CoA reductase (NADPH) [Tistlia consotensis]|uniref:Acrylyl-CoA reductase (NADPH) n=1 Tax=Tistlia consotensis USBA 355 TaxID=560819 RepID=A0A1Y6CAQ8_9PROT|nr:MDR family oxidoreductase [Tistlia consotensis]SMF45451.1 acrylyl-CoA reductase (NADPH) [Tistlia consotensis USBA 355]SNR79852.1 acrylyl-CoA reductase (NADPH) [Tistlia consotensis]
MSFRAHLLEETDGKVAGGLVELEESRLPEGEVTVAVEWSTLNYKDGMVLKGIGRLVRSYPHVPGVDFAGTVEASSDPRYKAGDKVVLTGWRVGEWHWGGYAEKARVKADWLVPLPAGLTTRQAMAIGTAGFTAMLAVLDLERHGLAPGEERPVLVTGAAGGVGSVAVAILATLGYRVAASTGRAETHGYLRDLGAAEIVERAELAEAPSRPLDKERWAACVDAVGGTTLAHVLSQMGYGRSIAAVGLAGGNRLETTVLPFLLRGVKLLGIDSVLRPYADRVAAWQRLVADLPLDRLEAMTSEAGLGELPALADAILAGQIQGRKVIDVRRYGAARFFSRLGHRPEAAQALASADGRSDRRTGGGGDAAARAGLGPGGAPGASAARAPGGAAVPPGRRARRRGRAGRRSAAPDHQPRHPAGRQRPVRPRHDRPGAPLDRA